jgi:hypothetical protein
MLQQRKSLLYKILLSLLGILLTIAFTELVFAILLALNFNGPQIKDNRHSKSRDKTYAHELQRTVNITKRYPYKNTQDTPANKSYEHIDSAGDLLVARKNFDGFMRKWTDEKIIYEKHISIDGNHMRTSHPTSLQYRDFHWALFGGSFTFGEGVADDETLPWILNTLQNTHKAYNLGFMGNGPNDNLVSLQKFQSLSKIPQKLGFATYQFIDSHIARALGAMSVTGVWGPHLAALKKTPSGLEYAGSFQNVYPIRTFIYSVLAKSHFLRFFSMDLPIFQKCHYDEFSTIVAALRSEYRQQTNSSNRFIVVLYPRRINGISKTMLKKSLDAHGIEFIDYSDTPIDTLIENEAWIPGDGHPTGEANRFFAELLTKDLAEILNTP